MTVILWMKRSNIAYLNWRKKFPGLTSTPSPMVCPLPAANAKLEALMEEIYNSIPIPKDKPLSEYLYEQSLKTKPDKNHDRQAN